MTQEVTTPETPVTPAPASDSLITHETTTTLDFSAGRPETFPEDFWDAEKNAPAIDKLFKSYTNEKLRAEGLRVKLSKGEFTGKAPEDVNEYVVELADELKPIIPDGDPLFATAREAAKEAGMTKEQFGKFIPKIAEFLAKTQTEMTPTPEQIEAEAALHRETEIQKLGASGTKIVGAVGTFINQLEANGTFSEAEAKAAKDMVNNADAVRVMNKLRVMAGGQDQVPLDIPVDDKASRSDIEAKMAKAFQSGNEAEFQKYSAMLAKYN